MPKQVIAQWKLLIVSVSIFLALVGWGRADYRPPDVSGTAEIVLRTYTYLHEHPELGKEEILAHSFLVERLQELGIDDIRPVDALPTAVIAVLDTGNDGPTLAFRAEMDARPLDDNVNEPAGHSPRSQIHGVMHNCGHDTHAAMLVGLASYLKQHIDDYHGKFVFVFQPAEEIAGGADDIVNSGILSQLGVTAIFAQHVVPNVPVGTISISRGASLAGSNYFNLKLIGLGSHAAAPQEGSDIPLVAAKMVQHLDYFPSRRFDLLDNPVLISVAQIHVGKANNVLASEAEIGGTLRTFENIDIAPPGRLSIASIVRQEVEAVATANGVKAELELKKGAPPTINDPDLYDNVVVELGKRWSGTLDTSPHRSMFAEDFAYYTQAIPSLYFALGIQGTELGKGALHSLEYTTDPAAFDVGVRLLVTLADVMAKRSAQ